MEIRRLTENEIQSLADLYKNAYRIDTAMAEGWLKNIDLGTTRAIVGDGRVLSLIRILPYNILVGGREIPMGGIGGVATWADQQGHGYAGRLMTDSVRDMRENGLPVSILYPFSHRYYSKFGWETVGDVSTYVNLRQADIARHESPMNVRAVLNNADFDSLMEAYNRIAPQYNGMVARNESQWKNWRNRLSEDKVQAYIIEDPDGQPAGFFICADERMPNGNETLVQPLCTSDAACKAMFRFLASLPTNVKKLRIRAAAWPWLQEYFREPFVETNCNPGFQFRVVDMEEACKARGYAAGRSGSVVIGITDPQGPWNEKVWALEIGNGSCSIEPTSKSPDVTMSIRQFSGIFIGSRDPLDWVSRGIWPQSWSAAATTLRELFYDLPVHIADGF